MNNLLPIDNPLPHELKLLVEARETLPMGGGHTRAYARYHGPTICATLRALADLLDAAEVPIEGFALREWAEEIEND